MAVTMITLMYINTSAHTYPRKVSYIFLYYSNYFVFINQKLFVIYYIGHVAVIRKIYKRILSCTIKRIV